MSLDKIFRVDEQEFVSPPVSFSEFRNRAVVVRDGIEAAMQLTRDKDTISTRFAKQANISEGFSRELFNHIEMEVESMRDPNAVFNFEVDPGVDDQVVERHNSRILELAQQERERRLNKQNKSIALRAMRHDFIDPKLLTMKTVQKSQLLDAWANTLRDVKLERPKTEAGTTAPYEGNGQESTKEQIELFLNPPPGTLRSQYLPWGKDDIIIDVSIYLGYSRTLEYHEIRLGRLMKITDNLLALGNNTLCQIKDSFHCPSDYMVLDDVSNRNITDDDICKNRFPSSFFFIHDTFYVDTRPEGSVDISEPIRKWAKGRGIAEMKVAYMDKTRLIDLHCRLGQPYVYVHQGNCEHLVCFTELRLRSLPDQPGPFPLRLKERVFRRITCAGCQADGAEWSVMHCELLPGTPSYMCNNCYKEFLYYDFSRKRCKFSAVPYFDRKAMDNSGRFLHRLAIKATCKKIEGTEEEPPTIQAMADEEFDESLFERNLPFEEERRRLVEEEEKERLRLVEEDQVRHRGLFDEINGRMQQQRAEESDGQEQAVEEEEPQSDEDDYMPNCDFEAKQEVEEEPMDEDDEMEDELDEEI